MKLFPSNPKIFHGKQVATRIVSVFDLFTHGIDRFHQTAYRIVLKI